MFQKLEHQFVRCGECGLERISPQPSNETLSKIYGAHYYDAWGLHDNEQTVASLKKRTFEYVLGKLGGQVPRGTRLLDCGAATGFLLEVAQGLGYERYALELSEFGAKEIGRKFGEDRVFCGELPDAHWKGVDTFDVVTMCDYIEHVRDPRETLRLARNLLKPGGSIAITTPDAGSPSRRVLGSGWTLIAAERLPRRTYGVEIDPIYLEVSIARWEAFTARDWVKKSRLGKNPPLRLVFRRQSRQPDQRRVADVVQDRVIDLAAPGGLAAAGVIGGVGHGALQRSAGQVFDPI